MTTNRDLIDAGLWSRADLRRMHTFYLRQSNQIDWGPTSDDLRTIARLKELSEAPSPSDIKEPS